MSEDAGASAVPKSHVLLPRGGCFSFEIRAPAAFEFLRSGGAEPLFVDEFAEPPEDHGQLVYEWPARPAERVRTTLYALPPAYTMEVETAGWFRIRPEEREITIPPLRPGAHPAWREAIIWGTPIGLCFMRRGRLAFHAASVEVDGKGILLAAPGTFGKTTLAGGFLREGLRLLSDDVACCSIQGDPVVYPGPALLRLRPDVFEAVDFPGTRVAYRSSNKVSLTFDGPLRGDARPIPLHAIVLLHKATSAPTLVRVPAPEAIRDLVVLASNMLIDEAAAFADVGALVDRVPVWRLDRRLSYQDLRTTVEMIAEQCLPR